jgi:hypothetical protein
MPKGRNAIVLGVKEPGKDKTLGPGFKASRVQTVAFSGIDVLPIDVQVQMKAGLPSFTIVGLQDKAVGESRRFGQGR